MVCISNIIAITNLWSFFHGDWWHDKVLMVEVTGPLKLIYVYNGIREKWSRIKWYTRSICTLLYINFDGLYIIMNIVRNRSLCTNIQIARIPFIMAPKKYIWKSSCFIFYVTTNFFFYSCERCTYAATGHFLPLAALVVKANRGILPRMRILNPKPAIRRV